jgi:cob(I)alamin adenosyltransferase
MVKLNKIYTRTGDTGTTGLVTGERRPKHDLRVETFGSVDEASSTVGMARAVLADADLDAVLAAVQNDLFDLGADLATPVTQGKPPFEPLRIIAAQVLRIEKEIDRLNARLEPLTSFVLPGGSPAAAALHLARTVTRRAERLACALAEREEVNPEALKYLNRVSDLLFVAARVANADGRDDVLWVPGKNR